MNSIIDQLQSFSAPNVFNPWRDIDPLDVLGMHAPQARISRLQAHYDCRPSFLLVGEAPGYQGCHFSGVPFTNEKLILDGSVPRVTSCNRITTRRLPWHPHRPGESYSNRTPSPAERAAGLQVLEEIAMHFHEATIVAVGRLAQHATRELGRDCESVRHPSMGGAREFAAGMERIVEERSVA